MGSVARYVVGSLRLASGGYEHSFFSGLVMSLGAGFYEEVAFRVVLFGLGLRLLQRFFSRHPLRVVVVWALASSLLFSAWHYVGPFADSWQLGSFVFRWICGVFFTAVYRLRGFAPAVWCHALYDVWVLAL
jgi:membrane protease YdiL (CAAX protease family)